MKKKPITPTCLFLLFISLFLLTRARPDPSSRSFEAEKPDKGGGTKFGTNSNIDRFFGLGGGFGIPVGRGWAGGYGGGFGGPGSGYSKGGIVRPTVMCKERGPCYKKKLVCPTKCFTSYSRSGKGYSVGGGCMMDCKKCIAYC